jgi:hypothetical protein
VNTIDERIQALTEFENGIDNHLKDIIEDNEDVIVSMNVDDQLYGLGITSSGIEINSFAPYSFKTIGIKEQKGQPTDRVTLRDTGTFHRSVYVVASENEFSIHASDDKVEKLMFTYGEDILGLTANNLNDLIWNHVHDAILIKLRLVL